MEELISDNQQENDFSDKLRRPPLTRQLSNKTSQLFNSILSGTNGIIDNISSKLESALSISQNSDSSEGEEERDKILPIIDNGEIQTSRKGSTQATTSSQSLSPAISFDEPLYTPTPIFHRKSSLIENNRNFILPDGVQSGVLSHESKIKTWQTTAKSKDISSEGSENDITEEHHSEDGQACSTSIDSSDVEGAVGKRQIDRSVSENSLHSWSSNLSWDSQQDETSADYMEFMKNFVNDIFEKNEISFVQKSKFGTISQHEAGRLWFARYINAQRVNKKKVDEITIYNLVQYFAIVLFECKEAEDYSPAKTLMNMCFTFYHDIKSVDGALYKEFLYTYLKEQPIWRSLRFWNAAFFDAVQCERARMPMTTRKEWEKYSSEERSDERQFQENVTFGQLGSFTCNMQAFGLSKELCLEFLRKQSIIANLSRDQVQQVREQIEKQFRASGSRGASGLQR